MREPTEVLTAVEQLPIPLFDGVVLAARAPSGAIYLALRDLCAVLGLALRRQQVQIAASDVLHLASIRIHDTKQFRTLDFLLLEDLGVWISEIQTRRVAPATRERFGYIKQYLAEAVRAAFAQLIGLTSEPSQKIEDLRELDRVEVALREFAALRREHEELGDSLSKARDAYRETRQLLRELQTRVQTLEHETKLRISPTQRDTIYHLVQRWGKAIAIQQKKRPGECIHSCWQLFNTYFHISTYTNLPAARFDEAVQFIKQQFHTVTGYDIDAAEQQGLEFDE